MSFRSLIAACSAFVLLFLSACGRETSADQKKREDNNRAFDRMSKANGAFGGYIQMSADQIVPADLTIAAVRNPTNGNEAASLTVTLRLGLFGGVSLAADSVSFDSNTGILAASFKRESGAPLEVHGTLANGELQSGLLIGPNGGSHTALLKSGQAALFQDADLFPLMLEIAGSNAAPQQARLDLLRIKADQKAPANSDLPFLPPLQASMRFWGTAQTPQNAQTVLYDPLQGSLELDFSPTSILRFTNVFATKSGNFGQAGLTGGVALLGQLNLGATERAQVSGTFVLTPSGDGNAPTSVPPHFFLGKFQATPDGLSFGAVASIDYLGLQGQNSSEHPFPSFPSLRLQILICNGGEAFAQRTMNVDNLDALQQTARFSDTPLVAGNTNNGGSTSDANVTASTPNDTFLNIKFTNGWDQLTGRFTSKTASPDPIGTPQLTLNQAAAVTRFDCDQLPGPPPARGPLTYSGHLERGGGSYLPARLVFASRRNAAVGNDAPTLEADLKLGLFGGVDLASSPAQFDWGDGSLLALFSRPTGTPLQLRTTVKDGALDDASLVGPNLGASRLVVSLTGDNLFDQGGESDFRYQLAALATSNTTSSGLLTFKRLDADQPAPANFDLPTSPGLAVAMRFEGLGQTPENASSVLYDPLAGTLTLNFNDAARIDLTNVFLQSNGTSLISPNDLSGQLIQGGAPRGTFVATRTAAGDSLDVQKLPQSFYKGTYQAPGADSQAFVAAAKLDYLNSEGQNTAEYPFLSFPNLRLTIAICLDGAELQTKRVQLSSVDFLNATALFTPVGSNGSANGNLTLSFDSTWNKIDGQIVVNQGTGTSDQTAQLHLTATPSGNGGCEDQ